MVKNREIEWNRIYSKKNITDGREEMLPQQCDEKRKRKSRNRRQTKSLSIIADDSPKKERDKIPRRKHFFFVTDWATSDRQWMNTYVTQLSFKGFRISLSNILRTSLKIIWLPIFKHSLSECVKLWSSEMIIFESILTTPEASIIFWGHWGSNGNLLKPKTKPQQPILPCQNLWNAL